MNEEGGDDTAQDEPHGGAHEQGEHGHPHVYHCLWLLLAIPYQSMSLWTFADARRTHSPDKATLAMSVQCRSCVHVGKGAEHLCSSLWLAYLLCFCTCCLLALV